MENSSKHSDTTPSPIADESAPTQSAATSTTHFGFKTIDARDKAREVAQVFHSVAQRYDVMNDLMSGGMHRLWKIFTVQRAAVRAGFKVLDIAGGTGDLARAFAPLAGPTGQVWLTDINSSMLAVGRDRLLDRGLIVPTAVCDAEMLPFPAAYFDRVTVAFGLRNMTDKAQALAEMYRVLKPGGKLLVLEFSQVARPLAGVYDWYSFNILPRLGRWVANDEESYRYLAESIRMHPDQESLAQLMRSVGFEQVRYFNLTAGVVALHEGVRLDVP